MSNIQYLTAAPYGSGANDSSYASEEIEWNKGLIDYYGQNVTCDFGNRGAVLSRDTSQDLRRSEPIQRLNSVYIRGDNGTTHHAIFSQQRDQPALWPSMSLLDGFTLRWKQDSTASRALWLRNAMISMCDRNGRIRKFWGSYDQSKRNDYNWGSTVWRFSDQDKRDMAQYYFEGVMFRLSTEGGTIQRETSISIGGFRLLYNLGPQNANHRWVIGKYVTRLYFGNEIIQPRLPGDPDA